MSSAHLTSLDALRTFRENWCRFGDVARAALTTMDSDVRRVHDDLRRMLQHWQAELKKRERELAEARIILKRRELGRAFGRPLDTTEQEEEVRRAKRRLAEAEQKLAAVKSWLPRLERAQLDYNGPKQQLTAVLEVDVPKATSDLDRMLDALEAYLRVTTGAPASG